MAQMANMADDFVNSAVIATSTFTGYSDDVTQANSEILPLHEEKMA